MTETNVSWKENMLKKFEAKEKLPVAISQQKI